MTDLVNYPPHYRSANGLEAIDVIEGFGLGFHLGNVVKYILRAGRKDALLQDLRKARWYLDRNILRRQIRANEEHGDLMLSEYQLCYLATPYTKWDDLDAAANEAARINASLVQDGIRAFSPIVLGHQLAVIGGLPPREANLWIEFCAPYVDACDALIVAHMRGWDESVGIAAEVRAFAEAGKPIFDLDPATLEITKRRAP